MLLPLPIVLGYHLPSALAVRRRMPEPEAICKEIRQGTSTLKVVSTTPLEDPSLVHLICHRVEEMLVGTLHSSKAMVTTLGRVLRKAVA